jgi:hypothetical protein
MDHVAPLLHWLLGLEAFVRQRRGIARASTWRIASRIVRVVALGASLAGCLGPVTISLPSAVTTPLPERGRRVSVTVSDERSEKLPARIGIVLGLQRNFVLEGDTSLATRLEDELVASLRTRGYRADHGRDAPSGFEVSLVVRIVRFAGDLPASRTPRFHARSVLVAHAIAGGASGSAWTEVVDTREEVALGTFTRQEAMRKLFEGFYEKATADLAGRVTARLPLPEEGT